MEVLTWVRENGEGKVLLALRDGYSVCRHRKEVAR
jgi:hypothetical protein